MLFFAIAIAQMDSPWIGPGVLEKNVRPPYNASAKHGEMNHGWHDFTEETDEAEEHRFFS